MITIDNNTEYQMFIKKFYNLVGLDLSQYKQGQMERRIRMFASKHSNGLIEFFNLITVNKELRRSFIEHLTINVTQFYRNANSFDNLVKKVLPELMKNKNGVFKIWSAGCSSGEEPYTLAMIMKTYFPGVRIEILATDFDREILEKAKAGIYYEKSMLEMPKDFLKYFIINDEKFLIKPEIKAMVNFKQHNLLKDPYPNNLDLILCRNVVIYFTEEAKKEIYRKFSQSLKPNGVIFVGGTEQISNAKEVGLETRLPFFYWKTH